MSTATIPEIFVAGTDIIAAEVNEDFDYLKSFLNVDVIHVDASRAFTSIPSGPSSSCTTDNQLARKKYVDDCRPGVVTKTTQTSNSIAMGGTALYCGIATAAFTMPTATNAHPVRISLYVPEFLTSASVTTDVSLEVFLYTEAATHVLLTRGGGVASNAFFPADSPSAYLQRTLYDNTVMAAAASKQVEVWGRVIGGGTFQLVGDATAPVELIVEQL